MKYLRAGTITVAKDFPMVPGELLRVKLGPGSKELRIKVGPDDEKLSTKSRTTFHTSSYFHEVGTNKDQISMVGNERKLKRV